MRRGFFAAIWIGWGHEQRGMMKRRHSEEFRWTFTALLCVFLTVTLVINSLSKSTWVSIPLHSAIETAGAFAALALAALLSFLHTNDAPSYRISTAMGLSAMGLLDLLHAAIAPGDAFVWLHGLATAFGGLLFMGVYLEGLRFGGRTRFALPILAGVAAAILGLLISRFTTLLPQALLDNQFASGTLILNILGGLMFLAAAQRFYSIHRAKPSPETLLFTLMSLMFGIAGLAFPFSNLWDATWWMWHLLRLAAYALSLGYVAVLFSEIFKNLRNNEALLRTVLESLDSGIVTVDAKGTISSCNPAVERMFGYLASSLAGKNIKLLMSHTCDWTLGQRADGSSFPMNIDLSPITQDNNKLFILQISDITEHRMREQQLSHQAHHDTLTQLPNRLLFMDRLSQSIAQAHRHEQLFAVMFLDLDNFKQINDKLGHHVGDRLLDHVAKCLNGCIREGDTVARLGGDEFVLIILDVTNIEDCETVAKKILSTISGDFELAGKPHQITCSIGISLYPLHGEDADTLIIQADTAMYQVKMEGRNNYCLYNVPEKIALAALPCC